MESLKIWENPEDFTPLQVNISPGRCKLGKSDIVCRCTYYGLQHDTNSLLYIAVEAGTKMQNCFFAELNCLVLYHGEGLTSIIKVYTDVRLEGASKYMNRYHFHIKSILLYINGVSFSPKKYMNG